jgi:hypothetical protein
MNAKRHITIGCLLLIFPALAHAYVDPGTGAYIFQLLIAVVGAIIFYATRPGDFFRLIKSYFTKKKRNDDK